MKALVLGGGSLKGAWQVGAIQAVLDRGFAPEMIYGISAGALNASFLVAEAGRQNRKYGYVDWNSVNKKLISFWLKNITRPEDVGIVKSYWSLGVDTMLSRFDGLLDVNPLHEKVKKYVSQEELQKSPVKIKVGAVNIHTGNMKYASPFEDHFMEYLRASSSIPIMMPSVQIGDDHLEIYVDGGIREVVPIRKAIEDGATEIYAIATHPKHRNMEPINHRSLLNLLERIKDISVSQLENNDIDWAESYNENLMSIYGFTLNKKIKLTIIRPDESVGIKLTSFNLDDIKNSIKSGFVKAEEVLSTE
ncbi:patatin-like phospholipase family protein [Leadbetterella sp. DM7]|uniref:patatin-like phospholipase family protein n=1 Tax=Leadbetterella sp. DM7 TaxID=3235085 RepID=UPI00349E6D83